MDERLRKIADLSTALSDIKLDDYIYFTCPICGKKSKIDQCSTFEQKDKILRKEKKVITGVLGKQYIQTTEVYSAYNIRRCKKCTQRFWRSRKIAAFICCILIPAIIAICKHSFGIYFGFMFLGLIPFGIYNGLTWPSVDIENAKKNNAIETPKLF